MAVYMRPSDIRYSQDSIKCSFDAKGRHSDFLIGDTLDDLYYGRATISSIPIITVVLIDDKWFSTDNRRLWIFKQLEKLGKCTKIPVRIGYDISEEKFTTTNDGLNIRLRGWPGGYCYSKAKKYFTTQLYQPRSQRQVSLLSSTGAFPSSFRGGYSSAFSSSYSSTRQLSSTFATSSTRQLSSTFATSSTRQLSSTFATSSSLRSVRGTTWVYGDKTCAGFGNPVSSSRPALKNDNLTSYSSSLSRQTTQRNRRENVERTDMCICLGLLILIIFVIGILIVIHFAK